MKTGRKCCRSLLNDEVVNYGNNHCYDFSGISISSYDGEDPAEINNSLPDLIIFTFYPLNENFTG
jgi:hypothetical protein